MRIFFLILLFMVLSALFGCRAKLLDERFHSNELTHWQVVDDPETLEAPSVWRVEADGWLHQRSNIWGKQGDFLGRWYGTYFIAGEASWDDYTLRVKAKPFDGDGFGVVFRYQDQEHFYRLLFIQDDLNGGPLTRLDKREGADFIELWSSKRGYKMGDELLIEVIAEDDSIRAAIDGINLFEVKEAAYRRGKIGLFCYAQNHQAFDEVQLFSR